MGLPHPNVFLRAAATYVARRSSRRKQELGFAMTEKAPKRRDPSLHSGRQIRLQVTASDDGDDEPGADDGGDDVADNPEGLQTRKAEYHTFLGDKHA